jgi:hypothetical protein
MLNINKAPFDFCGKKIDIDNGNSFVYVDHSGKQVDQAICCVQNK